MPFALSFGLSYAGAIAAALARDVILPDEFYDDLQRSAERNAFTVSMIESVDRLIDVMDSLTLAIAEGQTFKEWQTRAAADLEPLPRARRELVFRNAVQNAYGVGRTIQQRENADSRPYLMWDAINDSRTRESHAAMDGYIAPVNAPVWQTWIPPAGHNCRCTRISLTESQAKDRGYPMPPRNAQPDPGFDHEAADAGAERVDDILRRRLDALPPTIRERVEALTEQ